MTIENSSYSIVHKGKVYEFMGYFDDESPKTLGKKLIDELRNMFKHNKINNFRKLIDNSYILNNVNGFIKNENIECVIKYKYKIYEYELFRKVYKEYCLLSKQSVDETDYRYIDPIDFFKSYNINVFATSIKELGSVDNFNKSCAEKIKIIKDEKNFYLKQIYNKLMIKDIKMLSNALMRISKNSDFANIFGNDIIPEKITIEYDRDDCDIYNIINNEWILSYNVACQKINEYCYGSLTKYFDVGVLPCKMNDDCNESIVYGYTVDLDNNMFTLKLFDDLIETEHYTNLKNDDTEIDFGICSNQFSFNNLPKW